MAKVEGSYLPPPQPRRRGRMPLEVSGYRGQIVVRAKKGPKGPKKSVLQQAWVNNFKCIATWSKWADSVAREQAEQLVPNSGWYWRDVIETALQGKLIRFNGGQRITTPTANVAALEMTLPLANTNYVITPDTVIWDNNYFYNPVINMTRLTVRSPGLYLFGMQTFWSVNATARRRIQVRLNGTTSISELSAGEGTSGSGNRMTVGIYYFNQDDYIEAVVQAGVTNQKVVLNSFWIVAITPETLV